MNESSNPLISLKNVKTYFPVAGNFGAPGGYVKAVDNVSFSIQKGQTFGLVGESGCGKTTVGKTILRLTDAMAGEIIYKDQDILKMSSSAFSSIRRELQMIFQDPYGSIDPRQAVASVVGEAINAGKEKLHGKALREKINEYLVTVGLSEELGDRYPHEMSGGQRQRLGIARALACSPELIVCDEPVSALDVSIQAQIINLFEKLQRDKGLTYLFIAHDLAVVKHIADVIGVMYLGHLVEKVDSTNLYLNPLHPYTHALLSAVPITKYYKERKRERIILQGEVPSPINAPKGCPFNPRCPHATDECRQKMPELTDAGSGHLVACHNFNTVN